MYYQLSHRSRNPMRCCFRTNLLGLLITEILEREKSNREYLILTRHMLAWRKDDSNERMRKVIHFIICSWVFWDHLVPLNLHFRKHGSINSSEVISILWSRSADTDAVRMDTAKGSDEGPNPPFSFPNKYQGINHISLLSRSISWGWPDLLVDSTTVKFSSDEQYACRNVIDVTVRNWPLMWLSYASYGNFFLMDSIQKCGSISVHGGHFTVHWVSLYGEINGWAVSCEAAKLLPFGGHLSFIADTVRGDVHGSSRGQGNMCRSSQRRRRRRRWRWQYWLCWWWWRCPEEKNIRSSSLRKTGQNSPWLFAGLYFTIFTPSYAVYT